MREGDGARKELASRYDQTKGKRKRRTYHTEQWSDREIYREGDRL